MLSFLGSPPPFRSTPPFLHRPPLLFFFFNDTATTEIYTLSLHDALPICRAMAGFVFLHDWRRRQSCRKTRSEEHTSELQSLTNLVCRLLLEKKKISKKSRRGSRSRRARKGRRRPRVGPRSCNLSVSLLLL